MSLCGNEKEHKEQIADFGACYYCRSIKYNQARKVEKEKELELLAEKIANKIIEKLGAL